MFQNLSTWRTSHANTIVFPALMTLVLLTTQAQTTISCTTALSDSYKNLKACNASASGTICLGNPAVSNELASTVGNTAFLHPGDVAPAGMLQTLTTSPVDLSKDQWGIATLKASISLPTYSSTSVA